MGERGPARVPTKTLKARGSKRAKAREAKEAKHEAGAPRCPSWLGREGKAEWRRIVPRLEAAGLLAKVDRAVLTGYCQAWDEFYQADKIVRSDGMTFITESGYVAQHPAVSIRSKARADLLRFAKHLGLSPSARAGLEPIEAKESDPLLAWFSNQVNRS